MNRKITKGLLLFVAVFLFSCRSNKDLVYLKDTAQEEVLTGLPVQAPDYLIKTNDNLYVNIQTMNPEVNQLFSPSVGMGNAGGTQQMYGQLSGQYLNGYQVDEKGAVNLPVLGAVEVAGLTLEKARNGIQLRANEFLKEASVKVKLLSYKVSVMGEVKAPGMYYNYNNTLTVLEAISMANGITDYARLKNVLVVRPEAAGSKTYRLDLSSKKALASEAFFLQPGDLVYVEPDKYKNVRLNTPMYSLLLSSVSTLLVILKFLSD